MAGFASEELIELSRIVMDLANLMTRLLEAHESALAQQSEELAARARHVHHRFQALTYPTAAPPEG